MTKIFDKIISFGTYISDTVSIKSDENNFLIRADITIELICQILQKC